MSIPKKIHYCWFGYEKMSKDIIASISSWKKIMPEYELVLWDENKFDVNSVNFVREAYSIGKWAFVSDYVRLYAVYTEGGIYLDTDVYVLKRFDDFLGDDYFTSLEYEGSTKIFEGVNNSDLDDIQDVGQIRFESGIFGGIKGHPYLKDCMEWYEQHHYIIAEGKFRENIIAPHIYTAIANKNGFRYKFGYQEIRNKGVNMVIYPASKFTHGFLHHTNDIKDGSYAVHWWAGSWRDNKTDKKIVTKIKKINIIRKIFGKKPILTVEEKIKVIMIKK
jgi:mannosyltransferase OCH1-like enzyme